VVKKPKARYWAVKIQPQWVVTPGKQNNIYYYRVGEFAAVKVPRLCPIVLLVKVS
jgi:hypothetical protein